MNRKRVVSKTEYVGYQAKKLGLSLAAGLLIGTGVVGLMMDALAMVSHLRVLASIQGWIGFSDFLLFFAIYLSVGYCMVFLFRSGLKMGVQVEAIQTVVPLTQRTTHQLSVEESLVRASLQPTEQPGTVLLRAAQSSAEIPADQLLRSSASSQPADQIIP